jgi:hypothetical protein
MAKNKYFQRRYHPTTTTRLVPQITSPLLAKDVTTTFPQTKDKAITKAQQFDLITLNWGTFILYYLMLIYLYHLFKTNQEHHTLSMG